MEERIISLLTDFGDSPYVGSMKGAIMRVNPSAHIIDITHSIRRGDIREAAFSLFMAYRYFPEFSIHVVVVDPTVGSERRPIIVVTEKYYFVGPDNGVFSYIYKYDEVYKVVEISEEHFFNEKVSNTFHGRDIFGPVAGWMSKGIDTSKFGEVIGDYKYFEISDPQIIKPGALKGKIIYVDRFGNLITNITERHIPLTEKGYPDIVKVITSSGEITARYRYYSESPNNEDPFFIMGSSGFYEIAVNGRSAREKLKLKIGSEIGVLYNPR